MVDHSAFSYLMGPDGACLTHFAYGATPKHIAAEIRRLVDEEGPGRREAGLAPAERPPANLVRENPHPGREAWCDRRRLGSVPDEKPGHAGDAYGPALAAPLTVPALRAAPVEAITKAYRPGIHSRSESLSAAGLPSRPGTTSY